MRFFEISMVFCAVAFQESNIDSGSLHENREPEPAPLAVSYLRGTSDEISHCIRIAFRIGPSVVVRDPT